jgi:hypothetical protein
MARVLRRRRRFGGRYGLLFVGLIILPGCGGNPEVVTRPPGSTAPLPSRPPQSVPPSVLRQIVEAYALKQKWLRHSRRRGPVIDDQENRHKAFFARRRTLYLCQDNPTWGAEPGWPSLFARLDAEHDAVQAFVQLKRGTRSAPGPLGGGADTNPAPHLDLKDLAKVKTTTSARVARRRAAKYLDLRRQRVPAIVWRACAIHQQLWRASPALDTAALSQVLDHRLRVVERMNFQIASAGALVGSDRRERLRFETGGNPQGPWRDDFRIRMFEYPRVPASLASVIGAASIAEWDEPLLPRHLWQWETARRRRLHYVGGGTTIIRFAPTTAADWTASAPHLYLQWLTGVPPGTALDRLFVPREDWWQRNWLFCDQVVASLLVEGLLLALRRRPPGGEGLFNALAPRQSPSYIALSGMLNPDATDDRNLLISDGADDPYFDKTLVLEDDIQVGDHLIVWNSFLYASISRGEWQLENSIVIDADVDPLTGEASRQRLRLQGHGIAAKRYSDYLDEIAGQVRSVLREMRSVVRDQPAGPFLPWNAVPFRLMRWDPYEDFPDPGAWWIVLPVPDSSSRRFWRTEDEATRMLVKAVGPERSPGPGYHVPPFGPPAVFFPLFEPFMRDRAASRANQGWSEYFARRRAGPLPRTPKLIDVRIDGSIMPGLFFRGQGTPIAVNRYRLKQ